MSIEHRLIPEAQLHEPKGVSLATAKRVYVADGAGSGTWRNLTEDDMNYADKTKNKYGWIDVSDSQYTSGAPLAIAAGVRTQITNNGLAPQTDTSRLGPLWNTALNQFVVNDLNATYVIRFNLRVKAAAAAGTPYMFKIDVQSDSGPTIISIIDHMIKGGSYENGIAHTSLFYNGPMINNVPLKIFVTPDTPVTIYTIGFVVQRLYKEI
jgi:hypothetical protein